MPAFALVALFYAAIALIGAMSAAVFLISLKAAGD
jgi:hypothetical protein